jgi:hypothetical protein
VQKKTCVGKPKKIVIEIAQVIGVAKNEEDDHVVQQIHNQFEFENRVDSSRHNLIVIHDAGVDCLDDSIPSHDC